MIWKFLKQNVLFPKGLNWVQHWVSRIGLLIIHSNKSVSRTKHGLIAPRFASNYVKNSIAYRGVVLWNAIGRNLVPRVLSYPPYGAVGENPGNEVGRSNGSILD